MMKEDNMDIEWGTLLSVALGGALAMLASLLSDWLQHRAQGRELKRERLREQFTEVREYLRASLNLTSLFVLLRAFDGDDSLEVADLMNQMLKEYERWSSLPVNSATWFLFIEDEEVIVSLKQIEGLMAWIVDKLSSPFEVDPKSIDYEQKRLKELAKKVNTRLNALLDEV
jgi:hypothetical protein